MWFWRKKKKRQKKAATKGAVRAAKGEKAELFSRQQSMEDLRADGDPRWRREAWMDLREAADCEEGLDRLAKAVSAMLRRR